MSFFIHKQKLFSEFLFLIQEEYVYTESQKQW